jgi:hypothetical protein
MGREDGGDEDQGIKAQEDAHGVGDLVRPFECRQYEKGKKKRQEGPLANQPQPPPRNPV